MRFLKQFGNLAFCISDQVLFSATHFLISLFFGRVLTAAQYGAFSIIYATFLLVITIHYGLVLEPMTVLGSTRYDGVRRKYIKSLLLPNACLGVFLGVSTGLVLAISQDFNPEIVKIALYFAISCPILLTAYALRRGCYVLDRPDKALVASSIYLGVTIACTGAIWTVGILETSSVFIALPIAGIASGLASWKLLGLGSNPQPGRSLSKDAVAQHWQYGRWATGCLFLNWLFLAIYYPVLGRGAGLQSAATLRAFDNFTLPIPQLLTALSILFLPRVARLFAVEDTAAALRLSAKLTGAALILCGLYFGALCFFGADITRLVYPHRPYTQSVWLLPWICLVIAVKTISDFGIGLSLRAANWPDLSFNILRVGALLTVGCGLLLCMFYGITGAVFGRVIAVTGELCFGLWYMYGFNKRGRQMNGGVDRLRPNSIASAWQEGGSL